MASTARASGFLPTIKCSTCTAEIPLSMMGEHVCAPVPLPDARMKVLDGPYMPAKQQTSLPPPVSTKNRPPRLNPSSTCMSPSFLTDVPGKRPSADLGACKVDSFLLSNIPPPPLRSPTTASSSRSASPAIPVNGRRSPFQMLSRSVTTPLPPPLPSSDLPISQDCAFPPFPTSKSRSATPTTPSEASFPFLTRTKTPDVRTEIVQPPANKPEASSGSVLQRMNSIVPGPFNVQENGSDRKLGHRKAPSMSNSQDFVRPTSSSSTNTHHRRPSTSSSNYTRNPSISSTAGSSRFTFERSKTDVPAVPIVPQQVEVNLDEMSKGVRKDHKPTDSGFDFGSFGQENRSQTFPNDDYRSNNFESQASFHRRPSEPSVRSHKAKPSVAAAVMQPLHEIGSTSSFKPSKSLRGRTQAPPVGAAVSSSTLNNGETRADDRLSNAPPIPINTNVQSYGSGNPYHTPRESTSSNESYSSGRKTGSSRSSLPLNDSPLRATIDKSEDSRQNNLFNDFKFDVERRPSFDNTVNASDNASAGHLKAQPLKPSVSTRSAVPALSPYDEPLQQTDASTKSPEDFIVSSFPAHSDNLRVTPAPLAPSPVSGNAAQRSRPANKGNCKGCGELIKGKSVSSADGRLTGRYHKQCFVCKTCRAPFQTADFYVMHNHPYCGRHYHELNDSLCRKCDRGIEGQYLETEKKSKFHPHCFSCQECHRILREDYFEWNGRTLCEQHAFRAAQQPSSLGPGRRYPERRTTRLMMM